MTDRKKFKLTVFIVLLSSVTSMTAQGSASGLAPILPLSIVTPGAINPQVTQSNIQETICVSGYTATIRPPASYTTALKKKQLATSYAFYHDNKIGDYEEDHLISLEIGGSLASPLNLWPEPYGGVTGARIKDQVENKLHSLVCSGAIALASAQKQIASNWYLAYEKYVLNESVPASNQSQSSSSSPSPSPSTSPAGNESNSASNPQVSNSTNSSPLPSAAPTQSHPVGATGKCKDGTYSYAATHRGMCSGHMGVDTFYN